VTKDMIQRARQQQYVDADIYVSGHTHDQFTTPDMRVGITQAGRIETRRTTYVKLPSYKDEYKQGQGGYHVEKGRPPKPVGAMWLRFWMVNSGSDKRYLRWEVREALL
jgi:glycine cleavage system H lipoate-binding protein